MLGRVRMPRAPRTVTCASRSARRVIATTVDPRAILENWVQLDAALHPQGAKGESKLLGATVNEVFLLSKSQLEREVLSDPGIAMSACSRHEVNSGRIDQRVLAVLAFLSRSGLKPTVGTLRCGDGYYDVSGYVPADHLGDAVAISEINGVPIAGHQGSGSITDTTIRTLLTLRGEFVPRQIVSLMHYPARLKNRRPPRSRRLHRDRLLARPGTAAAAPAAARPRSPTPRAPVRPRPHRLR